MPAPPPESEPAMVSVAGVLPLLCTGNRDIIVVSMTKVTPKTGKVRRRLIDVDPRH